MDNVNIQNNTTYAEGGPRFTPALKANIFWHPQSFFEPKCCWEGIPILKKKCSSFAYFVFEAWYVLIEYLLFIFTKYLKGEQFIAIYVTFLTSSF